MHENTARQAADSACRQLGYTVQNKFKSLPEENIQSWKINDASLCGMKSNNISFSCFTDCINKTAGYVLEDSCKDDYVLFTISCEFNKRNDGVYSAGNEIICAYHNTTNMCNTTSNPPGLIAATAVLSVTTTLLLTCLVIVLAYYTYKLHRQHPPEEQLPLLQRNGAGGGAGGVDGGGGIDNRDGVGDNADINH